MILKFPKSIAKRKDLQEYLKARGLIETIIYWCVDWRVRRSVQLKGWIGRMCNDSILDEIMPVIPFGASNRDKVRKILRFVKENIVYVRDIDSKWKCTDKWQSPSETWELKKGDCEDGAILAYCLLQKLNVPDRLLRIVCGDVVGGGHAYLVFRSDEDALEYPVDWCYWYKESYRMKLPYVLRDEYFGSKKEWFSFNKSGTYKPITYGVKKR